MFAGRRLLGLTAVAASIEFFLSQILIVTVICALEVAVTLVGADAPRCPASEAGSSVTSATASTLRGLIATVLLETSVL
jgi:hypothetical protein